MNIQNSFNKNKILVFGIFLGSLYVTFNTNFVTYVGEIANNIVGNFNSDGNTTIIDNGGKYGDTPYQTRGQDNFRSDTYNVGESLVLIASQAPLREAPNTQADWVKALTQGDVIIFTGTTNVINTYKVNGTLVTERWITARTEDGKEGYIWAGGLQKVNITPTPNFSKKTSERIEIIETVPVTGNTKRVTIGDLIRVRNKPTTGKKAIVLGLLAIHTEIEVRERTTSKFTVEWNEDEVEDYFYSFLYTTENGKTVLAWVHGVTLSFNEKSQVGEPPQKKDKGGKAKSSKPSQKGELYLDQEVKSNDTVVRIYVSSELQGGDIFLRGLNSYQLTGSCSFQICITKEGKVDFVSYSSTKSSITDETFIKDIKTKINRLYFGKKEENSCGVLRIELMPN